MDKYKALNLLGEGTYGTVWKAVNRLTGEIVAIKKLKKKYYSWEECLSLREVQSLRKMKHPNVVKLKELIRENNLLYFVFEYMECNLYEVMKNRVTLFTEVEVRNWCFQVFQALAYMHQCGYFHRDLKPENLLVTENTIKIADFGLAREVKSQPPYTNYVSTRWYRAPEVLLQSPLYTSSVDMWAMGAILAELFTLKPLFPGSSEMDEIHKICSIIGSPNMSLWSEGLQLADSLNYQFPVFVDHTVLSQQTLKATMEQYRRRLTWKQFAPCRLSSLIPSASEDAVDLISSLCSWDPKSRPSAAEALRHSFFQPCFYIPPPLRQKADSSFIKFQTEMRSVPVRKMVAPEQTANRRFPEAPVSNRASSCVPMAGMQSSSGIIPGILMDNMGVYTTKKAIASSRSKLAAYQHEVQYNSGLGCAAGRPAPKCTLDGPLYRDRRLVYPPSGCAPVNAGRSDVVDAKGSRVASQSTWYRPPPILRPNHVHGIYEAAC